MISPADSNLPKHHVNLQKRTTPTQHPQQVPLVKKIQAAIGKGFLFSLVGPRGTGKTQMAVEIVYSALEKDRTALFTTAFKMLLAIKASYKRTDEAEEDVIRSFCKPSLLVIDECHERRGTDFENQIITHIINERYEAEKDTLLISNQTLADFAASMGDSVISRMNETGGIIECNWESFRK